MKTLPLKLRKNGLDYTQVLRGERSCIYEVHVSPTLSRYEVFLIKVKPSKMIFGKEVPAHERFPGSEDFSKWAWCCWDYNSAKHRFDELERGVKREDYTYPGTNIKRYRKR